MAEQAKKIKTFLAEKRLNYHVIYNETIREKELTQEELDKQIAKDYQDWANDPEEWKDARGE